MLYVTFTAIVCEFVGIRTWGKCSHANRSLSGVNQRSVRDSKGEWAAQERLRTGEASQSQARFCLRSLLPSWEGSLLKGPCRDGYIAEQPTERVNGSGKGFILWYPPQLSKLLHLEMLLLHAGVCGGGVYHVSCKANHERRGRTLSIWTGGRTLRRWGRQRVWEQMPLRGSTASHTQCLIKPDRKTVPTRMSHVPTTALHFK